MYYVITNFKPLAIMKTSELKIATAVNVVANATSFKSIDDLKETGKSFGGINFIVGDVITLPSEFSVYENRDQRQTYLGTCSNLCQTNGRRVARGIQES